MEAATDKWLVLKQTLKVFSSEQLWLTDEQPGLERHVIPSVVLLSFFPYEGVGVVNLYLKCSACAAAFAVTNNKTQRGGSLITDLWEEASLLGTIRFPELLWGLSAHNPPPTRIS